MNKNDSSKFVLLNLDDEHTKDVANAVSSKSGKKILAYMEEYEKVTESELSKELNIPMSTVNYTIEQLSKANLIENSHYHYSEKGREVKHWRLANKLIIIAPKKTEGLYDKIKDLLGIFFLTGIGSILYSYFSSSGIGLETTSIQAMPMAKSYAYEMDSSMMDEMSHAPDTIMYEPNVALWFFSGVCVALILVFLVRMYWKKK
jgi:predicted transcriptional regulator